MAHHDKRLRFALFGTGSFGTEFAAYLQQVGEIVAICEPDDQARRLFRSETGLALPEFKLYSELMANIDFEAAVVTSTNDTHRDLTVAAAKMGKHVFCEKPMANNISECWEMVRACEAADVKLMVGHKRRLRPPWARMIQLREQLGVVVAITACLYYDARPYHHKGWWTQERRCGGLLAIAGVHTIDWMRAMCGDVKAVRAVPGLQIDRRYDFSDTLHVSIDFVSGAVGTLNVSTGYPPLNFRESVGPRVICSDGGIWLDTQLDHIDLHWQGRAATAPHIERFDDLGFDCAYRREVGDFVAWIAEGSEPCLTWREGLRCVEVMEAARRSAREGGRVLALPLYPELEQAPPDKTKSLPTATDSTT
jgi:predicted dehydrogenase